MQAWSRFSKWSCKRSREVAHGRSQARTRFHPPCDCSCSACIRLACAVCVQPGPDDLGNGFTTAIVGTLPFLVSPFVASAVAANERVKEPRHYPIHGRADSGRNRAGSRRALTLLAYVPKPHLLRYCLPAKVRDKPGSGSVCSLLRVSYYALRWIGVKNGQNIREDACILWHR